MATKSDDKQAGDEEPDVAGDVGEGADGDGDDEKCEEEKGFRQKSSDGPDATSREETSVPSQSLEKKTLQQSYEDILFHVRPNSEPFNLSQVFLQDRRQTLRLKCPIASNTSSNRSKSFERPSDKDSLPALNEPTSARKKSAQGRSLPGWRPPPPREKKETQPKTTSAYQSEIANKLSRGLSSLASQGEDTKPIRASSRVIVSAKHRLYSNTSTTSASAAGYVYSHYNSGVPNNAPTGGQAYSYQYGSSLEGAAGGKNTNGFDTSIWNGRVGSLMNGDYENYEPQYLLQQPSAASIVSTGSSAGPNRYDIFIIFSHSFSAI